MPKTGSAAPRCAAIVGPYLSGKTTLLESLLFATGAVPRKGSIKDGTTLGDGSPEARARQMSTEVNVATATYLDDLWHLLDCPGSIELWGVAQPAIMAADVVVVVAEPDPSKAAALAPLFKFLDDRGIPHMLFINKIDQLETSQLRVRDLLSALQAASVRKLVLREVPIREGDKITGYVDVVSERAYKFQPHAASDLVPMPPDIREREEDARRELLEALADFDDTLLEALLEDVKPEKGEIYRHLARDLAADLIVPVFLGSAEADHGVRRLWKALRHEAPDPSAAAERAGIEGNGSTALQVFKVQHAAHAGRLAFARIWSGAVADGATLPDAGRIGGLYRVHGSDLQKQAQAGSGEVVALGRLDHGAVGDILTDKGKAAPSPFWPEAPGPVFSLALRARDRNDEVKLGPAIQKLVEEDPGLSFDHNQDTSELILRGQGDIHLQIAVDRLKSRNGIAITTELPQVGYRETIRRTASQHARFKRQTGGHGQFADITVDIAPLPRASGFKFGETVVGGVVPRQFIPAVEAGVRDYLGAGPLGFPVVDVSVTLTGGQYHSVDSSEMAFKTAGRMAMSEALPKCEPILLEPIMSVTVAVPTEHTPKVQRLVSGRRGQILGFDLRPGWPGWDEIKAWMPEAEIQDLIVELRSLTLGLGTFAATFDHLSELTGRAADLVVEARAKKLEAAH